MESEYLHFVVGMLSDSYSVSKHVISDVDHYVIIQMLLDYVFSMRWEPIYHVRVIADHT
jgi:hypothetical protein